MGQSPEDIQQAWDKMAENEANALMLMLERPDLKVMVVVVGAHVGSEGCTDIVHAVSPHTKVSQATQFHAALTRRANWILEKVRKK